ncbi:MAG: NAD-dependent epimerase/dehydratase family protein [Thermoguttaceae bacterium]|jgi:UDP-glucose 4-epimerase
MKRIAITGSSGYLGSSLIRYFAAHEPELKILGLDVVPPRDPGGHEFLQLDMRRPELVEALKIFQPDTVVHMAFVVPPMHDEREMHAINFEGSRNVLEASAAAGAERLLATSSATALGAWPDNPVPLDDSWPGRAGPHFSYAAHKVELEAMLLRFAEEHPQITVSCVRPCIVGGPRMDNYLRHLLFEMPIIVLLDGIDSAIQLVHEDDVSAAIHRILVRQGTGVYNLAPPDILSLTELGELTGRRRMSAPFWLGRLLAWMAWKSHFPPHKYPPGFLYFLRYPWLVASNRLVHELGFQFQHSSRETFLEMLEQADNLPENNPAKEACHASR